MNLTDMPPGLTHIMHEAWARTVFKYQCPICCFCYKTKKELKKCCTNPSPKNAIYKHLDFIDFSGKRFIVKHVKEIKGKIIYDVLELDTKGAPIESKIKQEDIMLNNIY